MKKSFIFIIVLLLTFSFSFAKGSEELLPEPLGYNFEIINLNDYNAKLKFVDFENPFLNRFSVLVYYYNNKNNSWDFIKKVEPYYKKAPGSSHSVLITNETLKISSRTKYIGIGMYVNSSDFEESIINSTYEVFNTQENSNTLNVKLLNVTTKSELKQIKELNYGDESIDKVKIQSFKTIYKKNESSSSYDQDEDIFIMDGDKELAHFKNDYYFKYYGKRNGSHYFSTKANILADSEELYNDNGLKEFYSGSITHIGVSEKNDIAVVALIGDKFYLFNNHKKVLESKNSIWYPTYSPNGKVLYYFLANEKSWGYEFYLCPEFCPKLFRGPWLHAYSYTTFLFSSDSKYAVTEVENKDGLWLLFNNAGVNYYGPYKSINKDFHFTEDSKHFIFTADGKTNDILLK